MDSDRLRCGSDLPMIEVVKSVFGFALDNEGHQALACGAGCTAATLPLYLLGSALAEWLEPGNTVYVGARVLWWFTVVAPTFVVGVVYALKALWVARRGGWRGVPLAALCIVVINGMLATLVFRHLFLS